VEINKEAWKVGNR
jgi:hypothetical protein